MVKITTRKLNYKNNLIVTYYINPDRGIVVAIIKVIPDVIIDQISDKLKSEGIYIDFNNLSRISKSKCLLKDYYKGVARCNITLDTFDESVGMNLALSRACESYDKSVNKIITSISATVNSNLEKVLSSVLNQNSTNYVEMRMKQTYNEVINCLN